MSKPLDSAGAWVDIFTADTFGGRFSRFRCNKRGKRVVATAAQLKKAGSMIVGPDTIARVKLAGDDKVLTLSAKTLVADLAKLTRNRAIVSLEIAAAPAD